MTTIQLIHFIASNPELKAVVIKEDDEREPMQAIELLSSNDFANDWRINTSLEKGVLIVYDTN